MGARSLRIAWVGGGPGRKESGGAPGVATELLYGLARLGHRIDCYLPSARRPLPERVAAEENLRFIFGTSGWRWNRWYSRTSFTAFASGLLARGLASVRLRRQILRSHREEPYDLIFQFSNIETLAAPSRLRGSVPVVIRPDTHIAGELRSLLAERKLAMRSQPARKFFAVVAILWLRARVQRRRIRLASLLICISSVFREHLIADYSFPRKSTVVIGNPVRLERFGAHQPGLASPPIVLVLGRISARKGIEDVLALARLLAAGEPAVRLRIVGGPSLWSDYTKLLEELPASVAEYVGHLPPSEVPSELARSDLLLQPSKYEPFGLNVAEALAAGVPVVATSEVGAIEHVDRSVLAEVAPGDIEAMAGAIFQMLERLAGRPEQIRARARSEAERLFSPEVVCARLAGALERLLEARPDAAAAASPR